MKEWLYLIFELPRQLFKIYLMPILKKFFNVGIKTTSKTSDDLRNKTETIRCVKCNMYKNGLCRFYNKEAMTAVKNCKEFGKIEKITKDNKLNIAPNKKRR